MANRKFLTLAFACATMCAVIPAAMTPVQAATAGPAVKTGFKVPRLSDGHPDLQGGWTNSTLTPINRPREYGDRLIMTPAEMAKIEGDNDRLIALGNEPTPVNATVAEVSAKADCSGGRVTNCNYNAAFTAPGDSIMRVNGQGRTSLLTTPNGQFPAPKGGAARGGRGQAAEEGEGEGPPAAGRAGRGGGAAATTPPRGAGVPAITRGPAYDNPETRGLAERCIMSFGRSATPPMFDQLYNSNYQFVQGKDTLAIWVEMVHDVRVVRIGGKHRTDGIRPYMGDSIGHWEGDTLVVETTNIPQSGAYQGSWEHLTMIERFTRVAPNRLHYQFIVNDPTMWDQPWGGEYEFAKGSPPFEYACHEGNYALEDVLAGARAADAADAGRTITTLAPVIR